MTEEKDGPVHYQVSVTGRQAAAFFLGLLAALGLSFFFGMKTGAAAKRGMDPISALTAQSDISVPAAEREGRGDKAAPEPTEAPIGFEAATPVPPADEGAEDVRPRRAGLPRWKSRRSWSSRPNRRPCRRGRRRPLPSRRRSPRRGEAGRRGLLGPDRRHVRCREGGRSRQEAQDRRIQAGRLPGDRQEGPSFRVRIGPYSSRATAEAAATKVQKAEKLQTKPIIVPGK